jgi:pyruvate/2-oxoglutarate dehydrogenase complex dihydrolipoamide acyltransferase (E2) component
MNRLTRTIPRYISRSVYSLPRRKFSNDDFHYIKMPSIMDAKSGVIDKWMKKVGDELSSNDSLCEITLLDFTVAVDCPQSGVLAEILVQQGESGEADEPIAMYLSNRDSYYTYIENKRLVSHDKEHTADIEELEGKKSHKPDSTQLLREIKRLIRSGAITDKDVSKKLQSLAVKGDEKLQSLFTASFDEDNMNFDAEFFIENATELVNGEKKI